MNDNYLETKEIKSYCFGFILFFIVDWYVFLMFESIFKVFFVGALGALCGCASVISGDSQEISVITRSIKGASCSLSNDKGTWFLPSTPGSTKVLRSYGDLSIDCKKDGLKGHVNATSSTNPAILGNIVLPGGLIGSALDFSTGAAFDYPAQITVPVV